MDIRQYLSSPVVNGGSGASGLVAYWSDASTITANSTFSFDGTTMQARGVTARYDNNGATRMIIRNDNAGAGAFVQLKLATDAGDFNVTANSTAAGDSVSITADSTFGGGMDVGILGANTLRLNTSGATRISASGAGLVSIGTVNGNEEHVVNGRLSIVPQSNLPLKLTGNSSAGTITFANAAASGKYNWLIGGQFNINNAFEITPSTAVDGSTFSTPVFQCDASTGLITVGPAGATPIHRFNTNTQTTVGAAGGASALPATPTGYILLNVNGTDRAIPYYAAS